MLETVQVGLKTHKQMVLFEKAKPSIGAHLLGSLPAGILVACLFGISSLAIMLLRRRSTMNAIGKRND